MMNTHIKVILRWIVGCSLAGLAIFPMTMPFSGCCTSERCLDGESTPDRLRVNAKAIKLGVVHNDRVSAPDQDRTDWKYLDLAKPGTLSVQVHWDSAEHHLGLAVFDVLGVKLQDGRAWGSGGLRAVVAVESPGRYYIRVHAIDRDDESEYALRAGYKEEGQCTTTRCESCTIGERACLADKGFMTCEKVSDTCTAWSPLVACKPGVPCKKGACSDCLSTCRVGARKCTGVATFQRCNAATAGCSSWSADTACAKGKRCRKGICIRSKRRPQPARLSKQTIKAKIISIYSYRGRMTLHIEIGDHPEVVPGTTGSVLEGTSSKALSGGQIRISRVSGRFAVATTKLKELGKNRWVQIKVK